MAKHKNLPTATFYLRSPAEAGAEGSEWVSVAHKSKMQGPAELQGLLSSLDLRVKPEDDWGDELQGRPEDDRGKENVRDHPILVSPVKTGIHWTLKSL